MKLRPFLSAALGAAVQYYDYHLYGFLAASIAKYFFPDVGIVTQLSNAYLIMLIAVLAKPIGAIILGRIGDIYGRSTTLTISLIGTAIPSFIISILPGYEKIGMLAAIALLFCRMCITAFVSAGTDGVRLFIYEQIGKNRQCFGNGLVTMATQIGSFGASAAAWVLTLDFMPPEAWRFAFALGTFMGLTMVLIRRYIYDDVEEVYTKTEPTYDMYKDISTWRIVKQYWVLFLLCAILAGCIGASYQFSIIFFGTYAFEVLQSVPKSDMKLYTTIAVTLYMTISVFSGWICDKIGRRNIAIIAIGFVVLFNVINAIAISQGTIYVSLYFLSTIALTFVNMPALALLKQAIPVVVRYRIFSLAHALGSICISASMPYLCTKIYGYTNLEWSPIGYFIVWMVIMATTINLLCEKYNAHKY